MSESIDQKRRRARRNKRHRYKLDDRQLDWLEKVDHCQCCGIKLAWATPKTRRNTACIDHCHQSGLVRGVICNGCNTAPPKNAMEGMVRALYLLINDGALMDEGARLLAIDQIRHHLRATRAAVLSIVRLDYTAPTWRIIGQHAAE